MGIIRTVSPCLIALSVLLTGCARAATPTPTATQTTTPSLTHLAPTITLTRTPLPTLTPQGAAPAAVTLVPSTSPAPSPLAATVRPANFTPSATSALLAQVSPNIDATLRATFIPSPAAAQPGSAPPLTLQLPANWRSTYTIVPLRDQFAQVDMNVAAYAGPVADQGTGFIYILWNFPSITPIGPQSTPLTAAELQQQMILADGYRLLRGTVIDISCTVGVYPDAFKLGGVAATGQRFQAAGCQDNSADIAGWYVGTFQGGREYLFYVYVEPVSAYNNGRADIQRILDTVKFSNVPVTPAAGTTPTSTTTPALY